MVSSLVQLDVFWSWLRLLPWLMAIAAGFACGVAWCGRSGWAPGCRKCGHDLRGAIAATTCPDCGADLLRSGAVRAGTRRLGWRSLAVGLALAAGAWALSPYGPMTPARLRAALADRLDDETLASAIAVDIRGGVIYEAGARRLGSSRSPALCDALVDRFVQALEATPIDLAAATNLSGFMAGRAATRSGGAGAPAFTEEHHKRCAASLAAALAAKRATVAQIGGLVMLQAMDDDVTTHYRDALIRTLREGSALVELEVAPRPLRIGEAGNADLRVSLQWPAIYEGSGLRVEEAMLRSGGDEWVPLTVDRLWSARQPRALVALPGAVLGAAGAYDIRVRGKLLLVGADPLPFERTAAFEVVDPASVPIEPVTGLAGRAEADQMLEGVSIALDEDIGDRQGVQLHRRMQARPARSRPASDLTIAGLYDVGQDGRWRRLGRIAISARSMTYHGEFSPDDEPFRIDPSRPFAVRIRPDVALLRELAPGATRYLAEPVELRFSKDRSEVTELAWPDEAAPPEPGKR